MNNTISVVPQIMFDPAKLKLVNPSELKRDPKNRNKHPPEQIERFCKLLQTYGMRWPILVSEQTGMIKAGEGRLLAALKLGMPQVLVSYQEFESSEIEYGFGISDNAIAAWAELDLTAIETDLSDLESFDLDLLGLRDFVISEDPEALEDEDKETEESEDIDDSGDDEQSEADQIPDHIEPRVHTNESFTVAGHTLYNGDSLQVLKGFPSSSFDSLVTDPPAGISFMGKEWDEDKGGSKEWIAWLSSIMKECIRVMKPGAHGLVWALPRTSHWTATALEDAGFEIRDVVNHLFGSGFPKSLDVSKAIDKAAGAERRVVGKYIDPDGIIRTKRGNDEYGFGIGDMEKRDITAPSTPEAKQWEGFGTALKPASEHWILVRKPCSEKTVAKNVIKWGCGALNIDKSRVGTGEKLVRPSIRRDDNNVLSKGLGAGIQVEPQGRFPANLILSHNPDCVEVGVRRVKHQATGSSKNSGYQDKFVGGKAVGGIELKKYGNGDGTETVSSFECTEGCAVRMLDEQSGVLKTGTMKPTHTDKMGYGGGKFTTMNVEANSGGASRFFYCAKPSRSEKNEGLGEELKTKQGARPNSKDMTGKFPDHDHRESGGNNHPTVKSIKLMTYLITMITPPEGTILDCFGGSGTTLVAAHLRNFHSTLIEKQTEYCDIILARAEHITEKSAVLFK